MSTASTSSKPVPRIRGILLLRRCESCGARLKLIAESRNGVSLTLLALYWASECGKLPRHIIDQYIQDLVELPEKMDSILRDAEKITLWARKYVQHRDFLYLARGPLYPIALEGALKLKEISYIHAEGYAAGEMKHGPIALIDEDMPVMVLLKQGPLFEKMASNIQEVKARGGQVLALIEGKASEIVDTAENQFIIPASSDYLAPVLFSIPLQPGFPASRQI